MDIAELCAGLTRPGLRGITPYRPGKPLAVLLREQGLERAVKLASNENPRSPSAAALAAFRESGPGLNRYPDGGGVDLRGALAGFYRVRDDEVILGSGSSEVLALALLTFLNPGEEVLFPEPSFLIYPVLALTAGGVPVRVPLETGFRYDLSAFARRLTDRTRFVFLCSPNNPTGTIVPGRELRAFARDLPDKVILVVDEAYGEYAGGADFTSALEFFRERLLLVTRTFSKLYALAGLRIGYGIAAAPLISEMNRIRPPFNTTTPAQAAAVAALDDTDYVRETLAVNRAGKEFLYRELRSLGIAFIPSEANFILIDLLEGAPETCRRLEAAGVIVRPVDNQRLQQRYIRLTIGTAAENELFISSLKEIVGHDRGHR